MIRKLIGVTRRIQTSSFKSTLLAWRLLIREE
jgi:hypothetical protein